MFDLEMVTVLIKVIRKVLPNTNMVAVVLTEVVPDMTSH